MKQSVVKDIMFYFQKSFSRFEGNRKNLLITSCLDLFVQCAGLFETYLLAGITDSLYKGEQKLFCGFLLVAVVAGLVTILISIFEARMDNRIRQSVITNLKLKAMVVLYGRNDVEEYSAGEQYSIIQDDSAAVVSYVYQIISYVFNILVLLYIGVTLLYISPNWACLFAVVEIVVAVIQRKGVQTAKKNAKECLVCENEFQRYLNEELNEMHAIRYENLKEDVVAFSGKILEQIKKKRISQSDYMTGVSAVSKGVLYIGKMLLFFGMGREVLLNRVSMKEYIVFYSYMSMFAGNFMSVIQMLTSLQPMLVNVKRLLGILEKQETKELMEKSETEEKKYRFDKIEFIHVKKSFGENVLFSDVNLTMDLNKPHALLGRNGSGKSTFMKMLLGEEGAEKGEIRIDGNIINKIDPEKLSGIVYFAAKPCVLSGISVLDNLLLGVKNKNVPRKRIEEICRDFLFLKDIEEMDKGFEAVVGKDVILSSGQMKKMELIRAILCDAEVMILDEPLANLDEEFKNAFCTLYKKYFFGRKTIVVDHDKGKVPYADCIFKITDGTVKSY